MQIHSLLVLVLCGMVSVCPARDSAPQSSSLPAGAISFNSDWLNPSAIANYDFIKLPASDRADGNHRRVNSLQDGEVTCYTMHIFEMKRESRDSDITEPYRQWTCQRASKYGVKKVEEPDKAPSR